ncbi:hypothetical protein HPP92_001386 [Vanilla planifolia]|uniref:Uncharacterized protein n=1 Tax=Vanilla planifolia TaxID=51239 RepID=A0A835S4H9_VANPL|nr:hypothetical protein HPP92_001386 [Vanilla planifolia]
MARRLGLEGWGKRGRGHGVGVGVGKRVGKGYDGVRLERWGEVGVGEMAYGGEVVGVEWGRLESGRLE